MKENNEMSSNLNNTDDLLKDFTTTYHNFGRRDKTTKWKNDKVIDKLIYEKLKKSEEKEKSYFILF